MFVVDILLSFLILIAVDAYFIISLFLLMVIVMLLDVAPILTSQAS